MERGVLVRDYLTIHEARIGWLKAENVGIALATGSVLAWTISGEVVAN